MIRFLSIILIPIATVSGAQDIQFSNVILEENGTIKWETTGEKPGTRFEVIEFRWNKWNVLGSVKGKGAGNNSYTLVADTSCCLYEVAVRAFDDTVHYSQKVRQAKLAKDVLLKSAGKVFKFSSKTRYEVYDQYGNKVRYGCEKSISLEGLARGMYYLNFGNKTTEFIQY